MPPRLLSVAMAAALTIGLGAPAAQAAPSRPTAASPANAGWVYSVLPGFDPLRASSRPTTLVTAPRKLNVTYTVNGRTRTLQDYLNRTAQGFIVLDGDRIVMEWYGWGFTRHSLFQSWSMAKSFTADAIGIALHEGKIRDLDDTVGAYVPELKSSAYGDVSLRNLLRMSSGIAWNEVPDNIPLHLSASLGVQSTLQMAAAARRGWEPGARFSYNSLNSAVLALVLQRATGMPFHRYVQQKIWEPAGMAADAYVGNDSNGNGMGYCCFYATVRDYARFGKLMLDHGVAAGRQVVPRSWVTAVTTPTGVSPSYGLHWWIDPGEGFYASGAFDQKIYVSTRHKVVIVRTTGLNINDEETLPAMRAIAAEVARTR